MSELLDLDAELEPERYELREPLAHRFRLDLARRDFLRSLGAGLVVTLLLAPVDAWAAPERRRRRRGRDLPRELGAWLRVGADDGITVYTGKVEVGQGIRTSLAQTVAEELDVPIERITMVMGDTDLTPYDRGTFGSRSTPTMGPQLRQVAATTRELLIGLAAERWKTDAKRLRVERGTVIDPSGRTLAFGALTRGRKLAAVVDEDAATHGPERWTVCGTSVPKVDARSIVTGAHRFASDLDPEGTLHGKVLRPPSFGATLTSVDADRARAMPGVTVVVDGDFVGVVARDPHAAELALAAVRTRWREQPQVGSAELHDYLVEHPVQRQGWGGRRDRREGSVRRGLRRAAHRLEARYTLPYIQHVPLEPRAALAHWVGDKVLVWTGTQRPFGVRSELADAFGIPEARVRVRVPDTGSGYGGKHTGETAIEAARLARAVGRPVKVVWTREEEFTWAYFRPAGVVDIRSGTDRRGELTAWEHVNFNSGGSGIDTPYDVPNRRIRFQPTESPARQGSYRALATPANHFARESHMDEIAAAVGIDPLELRRRNLSSKRHRAVLEAAAARFRWTTTKPPKGRGVGLAVGSDKGGYVSTCAEVDVDAAGRVEVVRLVTAFECGAIVNPDNLINQIEGCVVMGLGGALFEAIELDRGRVLNARLSHYRVPRFTDVPPMETVLVDRRDLPSAGAGETPIACVAPAIANAIFSATGRRVRSLPLTNDGKLG